MSISTDTPILQPYLFFDGRCEEALEFYTRAVGAKVIIKLRFSDNPEPGNCAPPGSENKVMHASFDLGGTTVMASDGRCTGNPTFAGFSLSLNVASEAEADQLFAALADGGQIQLPLTKTFFSPRFGMLTDKFGVGWMILARTGT